MSSEATRNAGWPPLVSVVLPTYDNEYLLARAIESVLDQTHSAVELLVVGAACPVLDRVAGVFADPRIRAVNLDDEGVDEARARTAGVGMSTGEFIAYLDDDDYWLPHHLELLVDLLLARPEASVAFGSYMQGDRHVLCHRPHRGLVPLSCVVHRRRLLADDVGWLLSADPVGDLFAHAPTQRYAASLCATTYVAPTRERQTIETTPAVSPDGPPVVEATPDPPLYVVVPCRDRLDLLSSFVEQLEADGGYEHLFVFDNGSVDDVQGRLRGHQRLSVFHRPESNIHNMWNEGWARAKMRTDGPFDLVIANDDVDLAPGTLRALARALRSADDVWIACPRLAATPSVGREQEPVPEYPMTGCFFAIRGELPLRFDEGYNWWYGDGEMARLVMAFGGRVLSVGQVTIRHLGSASTAASPRLLTHVTRDYARFRPRWE